MVPHSRFSNAIYHVFYDRLLDDGVEFVEVTMEQCFSTKIRYIIYDSKTDAEDEEDEE